MADAHASQALGPNEWLVDEMYEQYLADPSSVSESWQEFFADYQRDETPTPRPRRPRSRRQPHRRPEHAPSRRRAKPAVEGRGRKWIGDVQPLRGAAARIVANMEASLGVPTATSFREVPARCSRSTAASSTAT